MSAFSFETTPRIICEQGGAGRLGEIARGLGISRIFLVTDAGLVKTGLLDGPLASLSAAGIAATLFSEVLADPPELSVQSAVDAARADWAAFRDELLVPGGLAPHDWVLLKLFSLGREGARPGGASPRRPRAKA